MNDTIVIQEVINVNAPRIDYMQLFVDSLHLDDPEPPPQPEPPQWLDDAPDVLTWLNSAPTVRQQAENALRLLEVIDMAGIVPVELWANSPTGGKQYRTRRVDEAIAKSVCGMFAERNKATIRISGLELAARCNLSPHTARAAMARLSVLFREVEPGSAETKTAPAYTLTQHAIFDTSCVDCHVENLIHGKVRNSPTLDLFARSLSRLSQAEFDARIALRDVAVMEARADETLEFDELAHKLKADRMVRNTYRKRLKASFDALGRDAGRAVELLEEYGGLRPSELAALMHVSNSSCSRTLKKLRKAGLIEDAVELVDGYQLMIAIQNANCPTAGSLHIRQQRLFDARKRYLSAKLESAQDDKERAYWRSALAELDMERLNDPALIDLASIRKAAQAADCDRYNRIIDDLRANGAPQAEIDEAVACLAAITATSAAVDTKAALEPAPSKDAVAAREAGRESAKRDLQADLRAMAEMVKELPREDAKRQLGYAGYSDIEAAQILSYRMIVNADGSANTFPFDADSFAAWRAERVTA